MGDEAELVLEEGIGRGLVDADRAAQPNHEIGVPEVAGVEVVEPGLAVADAEAALPQHRREAAEILERDVPDGERGGGLHQRLLSEGAAFWKARPLRARPASPRPGDGGRCRARRGGPPPQWRSPRAVAPRRRSRRALPAGRSGRDRRSPPWRNANPGASAPS